MKEINKAFPLIPRVLAFLLPLLLVLTLLSALFEPKDNSVSDAEHKNNRQSGLEIVWFLTGAGEHIALALT